jgi:hypothetical protein
VEVSGEEDQRDVDRGQFVGEPAGEVDVGNRCALGADALGEIGERQWNRFAAKIRVSPATTAAAIVARRSVRLVKPAQRTYATRIRSRTTQGVNQLDRREHRPTGNAADCVRRRSRRYGRSLAGDRGCGVAGFGADQRFGSLLDRY